MRILLSAIILSGATLLCQAAPEVLNIKTRDGQTYANAAVENVGPGGIDIGYVNDKGDYVLKGLEFKNLPDDLQKKFGYNPAASQAFADKMKEHESGDLEGKADSEKKRLDRIMQEIKEKYAGQNVKIKPEDLQYAVYAKRLSVQLTPVATTKTGCVAKIKQVVSGGSITSSLIMIDGQNLPKGDWSGFIYPTGLKTMYQKETIPVYSETPDRAVDLLSYHLNIYGEYAGSQQKDAPAAAADNTPPDQADATAANSGTTVVNNYYGDSGTGTNTNIPYSYPDPYYYDNGYYGGGYYFIGGGGDYWPVHWWWNHHPLPPRPYPPHPPRPPHPPYPGGREPGDRATGPGWGHAEPWYQTPTHNVSSYGGFRQAEYRGGGHMGGGHVGGGGHGGGHGGGGHGR